MQGPGKRSPLDWNLRREHTSLAGTYGLYADADTSGKPIALMTISEQQDGQFKIGIAMPTGRDEIDWEGRGTIDHNKGHYDWVFPDGKKGRTTFAVDADGNLRGQVRGSGIDWDYVGKRLEGPVKLPER